MTELLVYIFKTLVIQALFYLFYRWVLKNSAQHTHNRIYLLTSLLLSFVIPFIKLPSLSSRILSEQTEMINWLSEPVINTPQFLIVPDSGNELSIFNYLIPALIGTVTIFLLLRSTLYLLAIHKLKRTSEPICKRWFTIYKTSQKHPFSFFSNVFIPKTLFGTFAFRPVLMHECVHVRLLHSVDRLILDFLVSLFWFNPFIYLYRNALIEIHEFQADEAVIHKYKNPIAYQEILFSQLQTPEYSGMVSHFNFSMIKRRIVMMNKKQKKSGWIYGLTLPLTLTIVFAFSNKQISPIDRELNMIIGPLSPIHENLPEWFLPENEPSIFPLQLTEKVKVTSMFGNRKDSFNNKEQWHRGIDLATPVGNPVLATADGIVTEAKENGKWGYRVIIQHDDDFTTSYSHLSEIKVIEGQKVLKGDRIALSGNSGASTAPHLHYEVIKAGKPVDPKDYITNYKFLKVIDEVKVPVPEENQIPNKPQEPLRVPSPAGKPQDVIEIAPDIPQPEEIIEIKPAERAPKIIEESTVVDQKIKGNKNAVIVKAKEKQKDKQKNKVKQKVKE